MHFLLPALFFFNFLININEVFSLSLNLLSLQLYRPEVNIITCYASKLGKQEKTCLYMYICKSLFSHILNKSTV